MAVADKERVVAQGAVGPLAGLLSSSSLSSSSLALGGAEELMATDETIRAAVETLASVCLCVDGKNAAVAAGVCDHVATLLGAGADSRVALVATQLAAALAEHTEGRRALRAGGVPELLEARATGALLGTDDAPRRLAAQALRAFSAGRP